MIQFNPAFYEESDNSKFSIDIMESDKDRIHLLISYSPDISKTSIVRRLKQKSVHVLRNKHAQFLTDYFRKEHTFRSESCFMCSIGEADPDTIRKYIENQG